MQFIQDLLPDPKNLSKIVGLGILGVVGTSFLFLKNSDDSFSSESDSPSKTERIKLKIQGPPGLRNYGNTCFINSLLQALASLPSFANFLQKVCEKGLGDSKIDSSVTETLYNILLKLNSPKNETLYPRNFIEALQNKVDFAFYQDQQDCHELLKLLMDVIDSTVKDKTKNLNKTINPINSIDELDHDYFKVVNPFNGYIAQVLVCMQCGQESNIKIECFNDLSLIIKERDINDLKTVLEYFFKPDIVEDVDCIGCSIAALIKKRRQAIDNIGRNSTVSEEKKSQYISDLQEQIDCLRKMSKKNLLEHKELNVILDKLVEHQLAKYRNGSEDEELLRHRPIRVKSRMKKYLKLARLPRILCIHLQRLTYDEYGRVMKINKHIGFDQEFILKPWLDPKLFSEDMVNAKYRLVSTIRHYGSESYGHYVTYRKLSPEGTGEGNNPSYDQGYWTYTSDETIYPVKDKEVLNLPAYMLFYERVQTEPELSRKDPNSGPSDLKGSILRESVKLN